MLPERIPSITELLNTGQARKWMASHPCELVTNSLRKAVAEAREALLSGNSRIDPAQILARAGSLLTQSAAARIREAINATGIILHTGLGRAVFPSSVVNSIISELKGCCTLAIDVQTGERAERDELIEPLLTELTGAQAATVVNNNAAATMLALAALARGREVIVSRGQLIEIGGSFRLPEVMAESQARLVEVGATNRTHLKDYRKAITPQTAALMRVHPSNYRVVGFTSEVELKALAELAHSNQLLCIDDLGAGALVGLERFGVPHEPTVRESIEAGADIVLFSGDKLIGASQAGIIVGKRELIQRLRSHPLMRAVRPDKTCLLVLERTLQLFRDPERLPIESPTYAMLNTPMDALRARATALVEALSQSPQILAKMEESQAFLGSGSLPTQAIPSACVSVNVQGLSASELIHRLRTATPAIFGRVERDAVLLDMRTITDAQRPVIADTIKALA